MSMEEAFIDVGWKTIYEMIFHIEKLLRYHYPFTSHNHNQRSDT